MDRESIWRKYAPPGHRDTFAQVRDKYRARQNYTDAIIETIIGEVTHEHIVDRAIRTRERMRMARVGRRCIIALAAMVQSERVVRILEAIRAKACRKILPGEFLSTRKRPRSLAEYLGAD